MSSPSLFAFLSAAVAATAVALTPAPAEACGGFVCSTTPPPDPPPSFTPGTPVNQSGEAIIYAREPDGSLNMTVQIRYEGDTGDFAWILPVPVAPEISVGSDAAFEALRQFSEPVFRTTSRTEGTCAEVPECEARVVDCSDRGGDSIALDAGASLSDAFAPASDMGPSVTVYSQGPVGPYETAVIGSSDAALVIDWLNEAGFGLPEDAAPPLQEYADEDFLFVALRMATDASTDLIQPVTLKMATDEVGCLPIRLTRIAATSDMPITTYFLGEERVVPSNYSMVRVPLEETPELWLGTRRWSGAVGAVVDTVGGQGFVTEYAGEDPDLDITLPELDDLAEVTDLAAFLDALVSRGYDQATTTIPTLEAHIAAPAGQRTLDYVNCVTRFGSTDSCGGAPEAFDPAAIVAALTASETEPRQAFTDQLGRVSYLTRMSTAMDPEEMTVDPVFEVDGAMPAVSNVHMAEMVTRCSAAYYESQAPIDLVIGDRAHRQREGVLASVSSLCRPVPSVCEDDGLCSVSRSHGPAPGLLLLAGLAVVLRRRRR